MRAGLTAAFVAIIFVTSGVLLAETSMSDHNVLKGLEAFGGWQRDRPGVRRLLKPEDQPPIGKSTSTLVEIVRRSKHVKPIAPKGFSVDLIASGLQARVSSELHPMATYSSRIVKPIPFVSIALSREEPDQSRAKFTQGA
jgi:hypothetical protein